ncbi:MAG: ATP-binding protein [Promethearchaeota archaeon]
MVDTNPSGIDLTHSPISVPPWKAEEEIGYVLAAGSEAVRIGDKNDNILALVPVLYRKGLRLGDPLLIFDYMEGELFGAIVTEIAHPDITKDRLETSLFEAFIPTQELLDAGRMEFLEQPSIISLNLFCTINRDGEKGPVDYAPHPRASVFRPNSDLVRKMYGLPDLDDGIVYGTVMLGRDPHISSDTGKFLPYVMREAILWEHEVILGTTGKGKTVRNKNDIGQFSRSLGGAVIILDKHGEYTGLAYDPVLPTDEYEKKLLRDLALNPTGLDDVQIWRWTPELPEAPEPKINYFTISFDHIKATDMQLYLPNLSPQGYVVLPALVEAFKKTNLVRSKRACLTLRNFLAWLEHTTLPPSLVDTRTLNAISRRLHLTLESRLFDGQDLPPVKIEDLLVPGRVSVFPMDHVKDENALSILALHIINEVATFKLTARQNQLPTMILADEAHNFFPSRVEKDRKEYISRLTKRAKKICKEGRKFKLRLQFATQRPEDIDPGVLSIVNTMTFFGMTPQQVSSLKKIIELPVAGMRLVNLPKRQAIIYSKDNTDQPLSVYVPWPILTHKV